MKTNARTAPFYLNWLWLVPAIAGGGLTLLTLFVLPPDRVVDNLIDFGFKTSPLLLAVLAIALFPRHSSWAKWLMLLGFIFYMGYIDSAFIIQIDRLIVAALEEEFQGQFSTFYTFNLFVNSFTLLFALFAYRLGGGRVANVLKLGFAALLVMLSGLNDLTMWFMYPWPGGDRPFVFDWASHVAVFIGRDPNLYHMLGFLALHLILAAIVMRLPFQTWIEKGTARWLTKPGQSLAETGQEPSPSRLSSD